MRLPRPRFSMRGLLFAIALLAVLLSVGMAVQDRYFRVKSTRVYSVADLMDPAAPTTTELPRLASVLSTAPMADTWWSPKPTITPFFFDKSLIVRHTPKGHDQLIAWLRQERRRRYEDEARAARVR